MRIPLTRGLFAVVDDDAGQDVTGHQWYATSDGYVRRSDGKRRQVYLHRVVSGAPKGMQVDHINHDKLDNRRENLRVCTGPENHRNAPKSSKPKVSGFKGVKRSWLRWQASIKIDGKFVYLGRYDTEEEAARAYNAAASKAFGEYACLNKI